MSMNRRTFLQTGAITLAGATLARQLFRSAPAFAADVPAKESDELAKTLKFCTDADKAGASCPARKGKDKAGQYCHSCQLFQKASGDKKTAVGKCMIMPGKTVPGGAWCQSWVKNPNA